MLTVVCVAIIAAAILALIGRVGYAVVILCVIELLRCLPLGL
jgi:preprotein translocase subunit Sss1